MVVDPIEWAALQGSDPQTALYSLAYAWARQNGMDHAQAVQFGQVEAYGKIRSRNPQPEGARNRAWAQVPLSSPLPVRPAPADAPPQAETPLAARQVATASQPRLRMAGQLALGGGLGALGFLALSALSAPPRPKQEQEGQA